MQKKSWKNEVIVGLFVLIALTVLIGMTFIIRGTTGLNPYVVEVEYKNVAGLEIGSPVLVQGFRTGRVSSMKPGLTEDGEPTVVVVATVGRTIPIYRDATASLMQQGFIGDKRLEIDPGTPAEGEIESRARIEGILPTDLADLFDEGREVMENLNATIAHFRGIIEDEERIAAIDATIASLNNSADELHAMLEENRAAIRTATTNVQELSTRSLDLTQRAERILERAERHADEIGAEALATVTELRESSRDLTRRVEALLADADTIGANANQLLETTRAEVNALSESLQNTSSSINRLVEGVEAGEGTVGQLFTDPRPFQDLQRSVSALRNLLGDEPSRPYGTTIQYRPAPAPPGTTGPPSNDDGS